MKTLLFATTAVLICVMPAAAQFIGDQSESCRIARGEIPPPPRHRNLLNPPNDPTQSFRSLCETLRRAAQYRADEQAQRRAQEDARLRALEQEQIDRAAARQQAEEQQRAKEAKAAEIRKQEQIDYQTRMREGEERQRIAREAEEAARVKANKPAAKLAAIDPVDDVADITAQVIMHHHACDAFVPMAMYEFLTNKWLSFAIQDDRRHAVVNKHLNKLKAEYAAIGHRTFCQGITASMRFMITALELLPEWPK